MSKKGERFAYVLFNRAHAVIDSETHAIEARLPSREQAESYRDALNSWWQRRPTPDAPLVGPVFGIAWPESGESAALLEMIDRLDDPERRLDVLAGALERAS